MGRLRRQEGQTATEYLGVVAVVAAIVIGLLAFAPAIGGAAGSAIEELVCRVAGSDCAGADAPAAEEEVSELELVEQYIDADLDDFLEYRDSADRDERLDWSTDECSAPLVGSTGLSFDFTHACIRHDFGYRNTKRLGIFDQRKDEIDNRFLDDMKDHCATRSTLLQGRCYQWAYTFYYAVRAFG
jgi:hypothetical protein